MLPELLRVDTLRLYSAGESSPYPAARVKARGGELVWGVDAAATRSCSPDVMAYAIKC